MPKTFALICAAAGGALFVTPAMAQTQSSSGEAGADLPEEPAPTEPAEAGAPTGAVGDIVVTAQRRSERLQDVPISVSAISGSALASAGVTNVQDLGQLVPTLSVTSAVGFTITFLRGVGSTAIGPGIENPVAIYLDGVYYASTASSLFDLTNIDRIEVLKGPQGTLFGRNATGGLIQVLTRDPTQDLRVNAHVGYGNYDTFTGDAYISGGIAPNLAADLSVQGGTSGDGYGTNLFNGDDTYRTNHNISVRSKWVLTASDTTTITAIGDFTDQRNSFNAHRLAIGTNANPAYNNPPQGGDEWDQNTSTSPLFENRNYGGSLRIEHETGFANISNIAAYRESETQFIFDADYTSVPFLAVDLLDREKQFSNEFQISSLAGSDLRWTAGIFYFNARGQYDPARVVFNGDGTTAFPPFPLQVIETFGDQRTESVAGYGQATYEILPATNLTLGGRYTYERRELFGSDRGFLADGTAIGPLGPDVNPSITFNKPTFRVSLDHRVSAEVLAYASVNTGFKSGGFNTQNPRDPAYKPEELTAYEVGLKTDLLDRRLRLNLASYYYTYKNIQVPKIGLSSVGIINGASARIYGVEADFEAAVTNNFRLTGGAAYTNAEFEDFPDAPIGTINGGVPVVTGDASGNRIAKTPRLQATLNMDYRIDLADSEVHLNTSINYNSGYFLEADNLFKQPRHVRINASVLWDIADRYTIKAWVNNITNQAIIKYSGTIQDGSRNVSYEAPRTYGITLGYELY
jgi:outer membrane receptor protein involved in Fe transport